MNLYRILDIVYLSLLVLGLLIGLWRGWSRGLFRWLIVGIAIGLAFWMYRYFDEKVLAFSWGGENVHDRICSETQGFLEKRFPFTSKELPYQAINEGNVEALLVGQMKLPRNLWKPFWRLMQNYLAPVTVTATANGIPVSSKVIVLSLPIAEAMTKIAGGMIAWVLVFLVAWIALLLISWLIELVVYLNKKSKESDDEKKKKTWTSRLIGSLIGGSMAVALMFGCSMGLHFGSKISLNAFNYDIDANIGVNDKAVHSLSKSLYGATSAWADKAFPVDEKEAEKNLSIPYYPKEEGQLKIDSSFVGSDFTVSPLLTTMILQDSDKNLYLNFPKDETSYQAQATLLLMSEDDFTSFLNERSVSVEKQDDDSMKYVLTLPGNPAKWGEYFTNFTSLS